MKFDLRCIPKIELTITTNGRKKKLAPEIVNIVVVYDMGWN